MSRFTLFLAAALVAVPVAGLAQQTPTTSVTAPSDRAVISYADLDISKPDDRRVLRRRLAGAIEEVCGSFANAREWSDERRVAQCRTTAWESADRQIATQAASHKIALVVLR